MPERFLGLLAVRCALNCERQRPRASSNLDSGSDTVLEAPALLARLPIPLLRNCALPWLGRSSCAAGLSSHGASPRGIPASAEHEGCGAGNVVPGGEQ